MVDPLSAFGTVAGAVQLAEIVCSLSGKLYGFFSVIKDASDEIGRLRDVLQGLESATQGLQLHSAEHSASPTLTEEHEVLPEITTSLKFIKAELDALQEKTMDSPAVAIPSNRNSVKRLGRRIKWVYDRKTIRSAMENLEKHKSNLEVTMLALGLYVS